VNGVPVRSPLRACAGHCREFEMLYYAAVFFIIALVAAVLGFGGIAVGAAEIAKVLFFLFLVIFLATLLFGVFWR
jgi:uncharacterized membrane protein YtjA (UPF0391 family)